MRRKCFAVLMAVLTTIGMTGCGAKAENNEWPTPTLTIITTTPTPVVEPTVTQWVAELVTPTGVTANPTPTPTETDYADQNTAEISGLIIATIVYDIQSGTCEITSFDPISGETRTISKFSYQTNSEYAYFFATTDILFNGSYRFDESYTKMAAMKYTNATGERHAGWLLNDGSFFDITEAVGMASHSDFDDPANQIPLGFTDDGLFVFYDMQSKKYYNVSLLDISPDAVKEGYAVLCGLDGQKYENVFRSYNYPSDWIDATHCVKTIKSSGSSATSVIFDLETGVETTYIPGKSRVNWNGRLSPDGTQIAFTSNPINGNELPDIFIVSIDGGDPKRAASHDFVLTSIQDDFYLMNVAYGTQSCLLLDWR